MRKVAVVCFLLSLLMLFSCAQSQERYAYDLSQYLEMGDHIGVRAVFEPVGCTEEEVDHALMQLLLEDGKFEEQEKVAEQYDRVTIDFTLTLNGETLTSYSQTDFEVILGLESNNEVTRAVEQSIRGLGVGMEGSCDYTYPVDEELEEVSGKTVQLSSKVKKVEKYVSPPLTDEDVKKLFEGEFDSVAALRASLAEDVLSYKRENRRSAVWNAFMETVVVLQYPEKEVGEYVEQYENYFEDMAEAADMKFDEFLMAYGELTPEDFDREALFEARRLVKNDMVMVQLSRLMGITLSQEEYDAGLVRYYEGQKEEFASAAAFEEYYGKNYIKENLIWDKAVETLAENALPMEETEG